MNHSSSQSSDANMFLQQLIFILDLFFNCYLETFFFLLFYCPAATRYAERVKQLEM